MRITNTQREGPLQEKKRRTREVQRVIRRDVLDNGPGIRFIEKTSMHYAFRFTIHNENEARYMYGVIPHYALLRLAYRIEKRRTYYSYSFV